MRRIVRALRGHEQQVNEGQDRTAGLHGVDGSRDHRGRDLLSCGEGRVDEEIHDEAYVEHDGAKVLIAEIIAGSPGDEFYDAKVKVLSEMIKHHVKEEEQKDGLFAKAKKGDGVDMHALGEQLAARKKELTAQFKQNGVPRPERAP